MWGSSTISHLASALIAVNSAHSSEVVSNKCRANEQIIISYRRCTGFGCDPIPSDSIFSIEGGDGCSGKVPRETSWNDRASQNNPVRAIYASEVYGSQAAIRKIDLDGKEIIDAGGRERSAFCGINGARAGVRDEELGDGMDDDGREEREIVEDGVATEDDSDAARHHSFTAIVASPLDPLPNFQ